MYCEPEERVSSSWQFKSFHSKIWLWSRHALKKHDPIKNQNLALSVATHISLGRSSCKRFPKGAHNKAASELNPNHQMNQAWRFPKLLQILHENSDSVEKDKTRKVHGSFLEVSWLSEGYLDHPSQNRLSVRSRVYADECYRCRLNINLGTAFWTLELIPNYATLFRKSPLWDESAGG